MKLSNPNANRLDTDNPYIYFYLPLFNPYVEMSKTDHHSHLLLSHQHRHQHQHQQSDNQSVQLVEGLMVVEPQPCSHLVEFRSRHGNKPFRALQECLRLRPLGRASIRRDPQEVPHCGACGHAPGRLYACVACAAISCHFHAAAHAAQSAEHEIAVDVDRAELFCCECRDQVYDRDFDATVVLAQIAASNLLGGGSILTLPPENFRKRRRVDYRPWTPDLRERVLVGTNSSPLPRTDDNSSSDLPWGLKGLNNLGNTCFMSSVLQALLHTPPLMNYFLSDRHNRYFCQHKKRVKKNDGNNRNLRLCLACDIDAMFSAVFSGDRTAYSPAKFLYRSALRSC